MRAFIILCFVAAATADISGYSYGRQSGASNLGGSLGGLGGGLSGGGGGGGFGSIGGLGGGSGGGFSGGALLSGRLSPQPQAAQPVVQELTKEFYTYTAPEEEFNDPQMEQQVQSIAKKNLQVIFIHAPQQAGLNRAVQNIAQQTLEQQTAIYVLTKQADLSQLANSLQRDNNHVSHKPEVHFIKYRTPEDANRAQQSIRAQYDSLGGTSSNSDEGVAPVINFASQHPVAPAASSGHHGGSVGGISGGGIGGGSIGGGGGAGVQAPSPSYLPIRL